MGFFDDAAKKVQDVADDAKNVNVDELKEKASGVAGNVLDKAEEFKDKIPGDVDDKLIDKAQELKNKLDS